MVSGAGDDTWVAVEPGGISTDADPEAEVTWANNPHMAEFHLEGDDVLDLQGSSPWTGTTSIRASSAGPAVIDGGAGPDTVLVSSGWGVIQTHGGDDTIAAGHGEGSIDSGPGDDHVTADRYGVEQIAGGDGSDTLRMTEGSRYDPDVAGGDGPYENQTWGPFETVIGSPDVDVVIAPSQGLSYETGGGRDVFASGMGDDSVSGALSSTSFARLPKISKAETVVESTPAGSIVWNTVTASNGSTDTFDSLLGDVTGTPGDDQLTLGVNGEFRPGKGDDLVGVAGVFISLIADRREDGADRAAPGSFATFDYSRRKAPVFVSLNDKADDGAPGEGDLVPPGEVYGGEGADVLVGSEYRDYIQAGPGDDRIRGLAGGDHVWGQEGNDTFVDSVVGLGGSPYTDIYTGGPGLDAVDYSGRTREVWAKIGYGSGVSEPAESDSIDKDVERIVGSPFADTLYGSPRRDQLAGGDGSGTIDGGSGRDRLQGGPGNDTLLARDSFKDLVDGGNGDDVARVDRVDNVVSAHAL